MTEQSIGVAIVAWPNHIERFAYGRRTAMSLVSNLTASRHDLHIACSSESQREFDLGWFGEEWKKVCSACGIELLWRPGFPDLGANQNAAIRLLDTDYILLVQDDRPLVYPLDLSPWAKLMEADKRIDIIRFEWPEDGRPTFEDDPSGLRRFKLGKWHYGDGPHLRRRDFMDKHGWYAEGESYHARPEHKMSARLTRDNAVILAADKVYFGNIGEVTAVIGGHHNEVRPRCFTA